jgi:hypothetical protein
MSPEPTEPTYRIVAAAKHAPCPHCGETGSLWPPTQSSIAAPPEKKKAELPGPDARRLVNPDSERHQAGTHGFIEASARGFFATITAPSLFGAIIRLPGIRVIREAADSLRVEVQPDALRSVADALRLRAPGRAVKTLERARQHSRVALDRRQARQGVTDSPGEAEKAPSLAGN